MHNYKYKSFTMVLPAYNEELRIKRVIEYYRPFARLIVVDNYSTDQTAAIVNAMDVELVRFKNPGTPQTPECIKYFFSLVDTDYILFLSCSEFIPKPLVELFDEISFNRTADVVSCVRKSYVCGELIPLWGGSAIWTDARVERLISKHGIDVNNIVIHGHNIPLNKERVLRLPCEPKYVISHLRDADAASLIGKVSAYASVEADHRRKKLKPVTGPLLLWLILKEAMRFIQLPPSKWKRIAFREIWARMVMHSIIYWVGWELRTGKTMEYSHRQSEQLWKKLISDYADRSKGQAAQDE